jgi:peptidoglycan/xylan/chitin deacetylase (PgdA/CDA1 family)
MLMLASFISCSKDFYVEPERLFIKLIPEQRFVKVKDSISFSLYIENNENFQLDYKWSASKGLISGSDNNIKFLAPDTKDDVVVNVQVKDQYGNLYQDSVIIKVYKQFIILKADDLVSDHELIFPLRWVKFIDFLEKKDIKGSIGIIGSSLQYGNQNYFNKIREYHFKGNIEFWNHGYDHLINAINSNGEKYHEFKNSSLAFQKEQLHKTQILAKNNLGFSFKTFGAPANAIDGNTLLAIEADSTLKVWFFGNPATSRLNLSRNSVCEIEYPVHNPDYEKFKKHYDPFTNLLVLQIHPNSWDEVRFDEFYQIIDFIIDHGVTFINPYEYYNLINNVADDIIF